MTVSVEKGGKVKAEMCRTHYGHHKEIQHVWLPDDKRYDVAAKLQQGVPKEKIIDDIRGTFDGKAPNREHIMNKKDIANIEQSFGLNGSKRHPQDQLSVKAWIEEWARDPDNNPILYYKFQGDEAPEEYDLTREDFIIVIQTPLQKMMMEKFAKNGVCCDSTHGTNSYDFPLVTLLVVDEFGEGFPVAHCITTHEDTTSLCIFFSKIKENCGTIHSKWFMSDMAPQYYNSWIAVMGEPRPKKLICAWHVDKAWREELRKKVGAMAKEEELYKELKTLTEATNEADFDLLLRQFNARLKADPKVASFEAYFQQNWCSRKEDWAYAYRARMGINTNMFLEAFHRIFKYEYLKGKTNKRVDICIVALLKFVKDSGFQRILKLTKGKVTSRIRAIRDYHQKSVRMPVSNVQNIAEDLWEVAENPCKYQVKREQRGTCNPGECKLRCPECDICVHAYTCNCSVNLVIGSICCHIHLVEIWLKTNVAREGERAIPSAVANAHGLPAKEDLEHLSSILSSSPGKEDLQRKKYEIKAKLTELITTVENCKKLESLQQFKTQITAAESTLRAMEEASLPAPITPKRTEPANKAIKTQARFYSVKRKRKSKRRVRYGKPTIAEKQEFYKATKQIDIQVDSEQADDDELEDDWTCFLCKRNNQENMIQCEHCNNWIHWLCAKIKEEPEEDWYCEACRTVSPNKST